MGLLSVHVNACVYVSQDNCHNFLCTSQLIAAVILTLMMPNFKPISMLSQVVCTMIRKLKRFGRAILVIIMTGSIAFLLSQTSSNFHEKEPVEEKNINFRSICQKALSQQAELSDHRFIVRTEEEFQQNLLAKCLQYQSTISRKQDGHNNSEPLLNSTTPSDHLKQSHDVLNKSMKHTNLTLLTKQNSKQNTSGVSNDLKSKTVNDKGKGGRRRVRKVVKVIRIPRKSDVKNGNDPLKMYNATWYKEFENGNVKAHLLKQHNTSVKRNELTDKLWKFYDTNAERLFLYSKLLEHPWKPNLANLKLIRDELYTAGFDTEKEFLVTKGNTHLHSYLKYYMNPRKLANGTYKLYDDYFVNTDFWNRLREVSPFAKNGKRYGRCAVVGNSGILLDSSCGKEIDSFDTVFRCNAAPIAKFAKDAGWKTNLTSFNPSIFTRRYKSLETTEMKRQFHNEIREFKGHLWFPCFGAPALNAVCMKPFMSNDTKNASEPEFVIGHPHHFSSLWTFWKKRNITKTPSTGFFLSHTALQLCDETHLYGFWPFPVRIDSRSHLVPYHYFDYMLVSAAHGMNDEFSIFMQYHDMGVLRVHHGECTSQSENMG